METADGADPAGAYNVAGIINLSDQQSRASRVDCQERA
jgi:hypothetical protein